MCDLRLDRHLAVSVVKCLDDPVQPHLNAKDGILVLARVRGNGHTNFQKEYPRYLNRTTS